MTPTLPLAGVRILSAEGGPYGTMFLAQLGAEVIRIGPPQGGDTDALPAEAGVDAAEIARLRAARIV